MKARTENGQVVKYKRLQKKKKKSDGSVILNFRKANTTTLEAEGFYDVEIDNFDPRTEGLRSIEWDAANNVFKRTKETKTLDKTLAEYKEARIAELDKLLAKELAPTDWHYIKAQEVSSYTVPSEVVTERTNLRTKHTERENEINALTTKKKVVEYTVRLFDLDNDILP